MGFTAALFALGTATVIAAVVPVPDEATKGLMLALDDELRSRHARPPQALVERARRDAADERARRGLRLLRRGLTTLEPVKTKSVRSTVELVLIVAAALFFALTLQAFAIKPYRIPTGSMEPTLKIGQRIIVDRFCAPHRRRPQARRRDRLLPARTAPTRATAGTSAKGPFYSGGPETRHACSKPTRDALGHDVRQARRRPAGRPDRGHQRPRDPQRQAGAASRSRPPARAPSATSTR